MKNFFVNSRNRLSPNLWGFCNKDLSPNVISSTSQQVSFSVLYENSQVFLSGVYASTSHVIRRELWYDLTALQQNYNGPWCFIGDFNTILRAHEKRGVCLPNPISWEEFKTWTNNSNLTRFLTRGSEFTWTNLRRGRAHIDMQLD